MQRIAINPELAAALSEEFAEFEVSVPFALETESRQKTDRTLIPGDEGIPTDAVQNLNVVLRTSFSSLPSVWQQCLQDGFNSLGLSFRSWQRGAFNVTLEQYTGLLASCGIEGLP